MIRKIHVCLKILVLLVAAMRMTSGAQQLPQNSGPSLQDGTPMCIRINRTLSSADAKVAENVTFEFVDEIKTGACPQGTTLCLWRSGFKPGSAQYLSPRVALSPF